MKPETLWWYSVAAHRRGWTPVAKVLKSLNFLLFHAVLPYEVELHRDVILWHRGLGVVVHPSTVIGRRVRIAQGVTIGGGDWRAVTEHRVVLEDDVTLTVGSVVIPREGSGLTIGAGAIVGANAVVTRDVEARAVVVGPKAERIR